MVSDLRITELTCNYLSDPLGIDSPPRFSWKAVSGRRGQRQSAYRLLVSRSEEALVDGRADAWDTGVRAGDRSVLVPYEGPPLAPRARFHWQVIVFDREGLPATSAPAWFETGKRDEPWEARWIGVPGMDIEREDTTFNAPLLRTTFACASPVTEARLYVSGLGLYEASLNGRSVTENVLLQNFTRYDATVLYNTYDVTPLVHAGRNSLCVTLGNGWYNCVSSGPWYTRQATWRSVPKLRCELHVAHADGARSVVLSRPGWRTHPGPITFNSIRSGEFYDARLEIPGWELPEFDDSAWAQTVIVRPPGGVALAEEMEPIRTCAEIRAARTWNLPSGSWMFDIGQNLAGVARVKLRGRRGTEVTLHHNDVILPDGSLPRHGSVQDRNEYQIARYVKKSDGEEVWQPRFVYYGFQYVEVVGLDYEPEPSDVTALFQHTDLPRRGAFECSDATLNGIVRIADWATLSNYHGLPTDCPHREKNGWIGDSALSSEQTMIAYAPMAGYRKWMRDFRDCQKPTGAVPCVVPSTGWGYGAWNGPDYSSTLTTIPWLLYLYCGDTEQLAACYEPMKRNISFQLEMSDDLVVNCGGGDWCAPFDGEAYFENMASYKAPRAVTDTAYLHSSARTLAAIARVLGHAEDATAYTRLADRVKDSFRRHFFDAAAIRVSGDCQTSTACMLHHGLCDGAERPAVLALLLRQIEEAGGHLDFGIFGSKAVMQSLGEEGRSDIGYAMASLTTYPGWGWWLAQGATTLWECWNGRGSRNHHMFADVIAFFHKYLAGISPDENEPGYRHIVLRPAVDCGLAWATGSHESMLGTIRCAWKKTEGEVAIAVSVPVGAGASLHVPLRYAARITEGGVPVGEAPGIGARTGDGVVLTLESGVYDFRCADRGA